MLHHYRDVRDRIPSPPLWWDEYGVPRYCAFSPDEVANIYADEAVLVEIACQDCGTRFSVAFSKSKHDLREIMRKEKPVSLAERIRDGSIHYGDPPNVGCCPAGPTMNCDDIRVLEYWHRHDERWTKPDPERPNLRVVSDLTNYFGWQRDGTLEIALPDADAAFGTQNSTRAPGGATE